METQSTNNTNDTRKEWISPELKTMGVMGGIPIPSSEAFGYTSS